MTFITIVLLIAGAIFIPNIISYAWDNIFLIIGLFFSYLAVGVGWSLIKWNEQIKKVLYFIKEKSSGYDFDSQDSRRFFYDMIEKQFGYSGLSYHDSFDDMVSKILPKANKNKGAITAWITYWPLSLLGTLFNNPFRRLISFIFNSIVDWYGKISDKQRSRILK